MRLNFLSKNLHECRKNATVPTVLERRRAGVHRVHCGRRVPPDIPVAKVVKVTQSNTDLEANIVLQPLVNLDDLTYLKVLRWPELKAG